MSSALEDATCGAVGAVVALASTYPLTLAKVRIQAQRNSENNAGRSNKSKEGGAPVEKYAGAFDCIFKVVRRSGFCGLYVGIKEAALKAAMTNFIFYFFLSVLGPFFRARGKRSVSAVSTLALGIVTGIFVQLVVLPVDMVVTRLQVLRDKPSIFNVVSKKC